MKDLKNIGITLGTCITVFTGIWFFTKENVKAFVKDVIVEYHQGNDHKVSEYEFFREYMQTAEFERSMSTYLVDRTNPSGVSFRKLLSIRLGVDEDKVVDMIAQLFDPSKDEEIEKNRKRLFNTLRLLNRLYPEENVWTVD